MPNHVTNVLTITGSAEDVKKVLDTIKSDDGKLHIDFNKIIPMPIELRGTTSPAKIVSQKEMDEWLAKKERGELNEWQLGCRPITQAENDELIKLHGFNDWYNWSIANWDTKWNAYDSTLDVEGGEEAVITFLTAWSTPQAVIIALSQQFPNVTFKVEFADEDFGHNVGGYIIVDGEVVDCQYPDGGSEDALIMAIDITGDEHAITERLTDTDGELDEYEQNLVKIAFDRGYLLEDYSPAVLTKMKEMALAIEDYEKVVEIDRLIAIR